jgi:uncharacterized coiled-coil DUF342 family protein
MSNSLSSLSSLSGSHEPSKQAEIEKLIYGCSPTETKEKVQQLQYRMVEYLDKTSSNIQRVRGHLSKNTTESKRVRCLLDEYKNTLDEVESLVGAEYDRIEASFRSIIGKFKNVILTRAVERTPCVEQITNEVSMTQTLFDCARARISELIAKLNDLDGQLAEARKVEQNDLITEIRALRKNLNEQFAKSDEQFAETRALMDHALKLAGLYDIYYPEEEDSCEYEYEYEYYSDDE